MPAACGHMRRRGEGREGSVHLRMADLLGMASSFDLPDREGPKAIVNSAYASRQQGGRIDGRCVWPMQAGRAIGQSRRKVIGPLHDWRLTRGAVGLTHARHGQGSQHDESDGLHDGRCCFLVAHFEGVRPAEDWEELATMGALQSLE